jgi:hypothetical protein
MYTFKFVQNKRTEPNKFDMKQKCFYCNNFTAVVIKIGNTFVCKTCLTRAIEKLDDINLNSESYPDEKFLMDC